MTATTDASTKPSDPSWSRLMASASAWTLLEHASIQGTRFAANLLLTRLLVPEVFGIMQILTAIIIGLEMVSDVGVHVNIVQSAKGDEISFRRTAWVVQILRNSFLFIIVALSAAPIAHIYHAPQLLYLLPVASITALIQGTASTNVALYQRSMKLRPFILLKIYGHLLGLVTSVLLVIFWRADPWALVLGSLTGALGYSIASHLTTPGAPMWPQWEKNAVTELVGFGRWVFLSSACTFAVRHLDRLILGLFVTKADLGFYGLAAAIAMVAIEPLLSLCGNVLLPSYAHLNRSISCDKTIAHHIRRLRGSFFLLGAVPCTILLFFSEPIISMLYPPAYQEVSWMLRILAAGALLSCVTCTIEPVLLARGDSLRMLLANAVKAVIQLSGILLAGHYWGMKGMLVAIALSNLITYPLLAFLVRPYNAWYPRLDLALFSTAAIIMALSATYRG